MSDTEWLQGLAGLGLPGAATQLDLPVSIDEVVVDAARHKLTGVLAAAVAEGAVTLASDDRVVVARAHENAMREVLLLEEVLLEAVAVLKKAGIEHRVLKGAALAHMVHLDPAERCFGDNDVLVASADIDRAVAALTAAGATRPMPPLSASYDRRFAKSVTLRWSGATELDLHRTLAAGPYGHVIDLDDLFGNPAEILLAGRAVHTLPAELHLLHGALHVALGDVDYRLGNVRDLALLSAWPSIDHDRVIETAQRWGCAAPLAEGLRTTAGLGHQRTPIEMWAQTHVATDRDRRWLEVYRRRDGRFRRQALASLSVLGWRDRVAFSVALLRPRAAN